VRGEPLPPADGKPPAARVRDGTWDCAIAEWRTRDSYLRLEPSTQDGYETWLGRIAEAFGGNLMSSTTGDEIDLFYDLWRKKGIGQQLKTLTVVFRRVVKIARRKRRKIDPDLLLDLELEDVQTVSHGAWTDTEIAIWRAMYPLDHPARWIMELAHLLGMGGAELRRLAPEHIDDDGYVMLGRSKMKRRGGGLQISNINDDPILKEVIEALPVPTDGGPYLRNAHGDLWTQSNLSKMFRKWTRAAKLPEDFDLHGGRATMICNQREAGVADEAGMLRSGHRERSIYKNVYGKGADMREVARDAQRQTVADRIRRQAAPLKAVS
jgi:integrase